MNKHLFVLSLSLTTLFSACDLTNKNAIVVNVGTPSAAPASSSSGTTPTPAPVTTPTPDPREVAKKQIEQVFQDATNAVNTDDLDALMAAYHSTSQELVFFQNLKASGITQLGIRMENQSFEISGVSEATATARIRRKVTNQMGTYVEEVIATFKKSGERWAIFSVVTVNGDSAGFSS
ncbi:hypothetical protein COW36_11820 [bacterium (Candidatus Blackallbacteria) CG17_big_fil_post_rev_8_21_14_2_50_48_46]|uniref:Uncharacterized protein n=1 Tax=bacterium (Candidatus Blackallbacteria) CG17_big_fil_post_rev_8_21_14_2_50_48_46 TaxID=2014261 RepID=A0A2M7G3V4_9BACT|nr:MAG: hypothetical protein COW64_03445 [bacterium (Candidatus Blackallbacteria) CG18_big_fil_WC_8_21_14_2_50_49_26]PIW16451.1 MAG: hypothetical protein COW36_11820 [bacterium (Candidatus Blackallbacteria) CG17_big_fil_post_rev_8_21_14_2_50_48_46]PIW45959.1 MAG: hypothetical protein COW20_17085 [bacterium (Candidatus Blackallbacteria) CG13_big_fil_rev_8_21_14_2_50_49_14]